MSKTRQPRISAVSGKGTKLSVKWVDGSSAVIDLATDIAKFAALKPLRDAREFAHVKVGPGGHSVVWPSGVDMGADSLWQDSLAAMGKTASAEFIRWRADRGLSLASAAEALGLSRRMVAYYSSGEKEVPKTVLLACKGWDIVAAK